MADFFLTAQEKCLPAFGQRMRSIRSFLNERQEPQSRLPEADGPVSAKGCHSEMPISAIPLVALVTQKVPLLLQPALRKRRRRPGAFLGVIGWE